MFAMVMSLMFSAMAPYYIYKSLKREKLSQKLSGITTAMTVIFIFIGTRTPFNLRFEVAFAFLGLGVSFLLFYFAYKEKNLFACIAGVIVFVLSIYLFLLKKLI